MNIRNIAASSVVAAFMATGAFANMLTVDAITASWSAVDPAAGVTVDNAGNPITLRWGTVSAGNPQSGYDFQSVATPLGPLAADTAFSLGTFTHLNNAISAPSLNSVDLNVGFTVGGNLINSVFSITHDETSNSTDSCPTGSVSVCDDIVSISNNLGGGTFDIGGVEYILSVLGFSTDDGATIVTDFLTAEGAPNSAKLYAEFTIAPSQVPLPAGVLLMGTALAGFGVMRRKKKAA